MRFTTLFFTTLATLLVSALPASNPQLAPLHDFKGESSAQGRYVVLLRRGINKSAHVAWAHTTLGSPITPDSNGWDPAIINGYAIRANTTTIQQLRASRDVESIYQDVIATISANVTAKGQPWGLQRISQNIALPAGSNPLLLNYTYKYDSTGGKGVDVYVIDTGINAAHVEFQGRAKAGPSFGWPNSIDTTGHGTHVAGTIAGRTVGVAKSVNVIAIKVLGGPDGSGYNSDVISAINYVAKQVKITKRPSVINMSLGSPGYLPLDKAVNSIITAGVHVIVAAGNEYQNASLVSPARNANAITVCASDIANKFAYFSNYGSIVDLCAPGVSIISAWSKNTTALVSISGTSMAAPHVAGFVAYSIALKGNRTPANMSTYIKGLALKNVIKSVPVGTPNLLLRNERK